MATIDRRGMTVDATDSPIAGNPNPGLAIKVPARVATTANIVLSGLQTIDGIALAAGDRVLVWQQIDTTANGIYNCWTGPWKRAPDAKDDSQWVNGCRLLVTSGNVYALSEFVVATPDPIRLGTTHLSIIQRPNIFTGAVFTGAVTVTNPVPDINSLTIRTGSATRYAAIGIGRTADDGTIGVVGVANQFFTGTAAGDFVIKGLSSNKLWFGIGGLSAAGYIDSSNGWNFLTPQTTTVADGNGAAFRSGASTKYTAISIGRTAEEGVVGVAGAANQFFTGTAAGDLAIKGTNANKLWFGIGGLTSAGHINSSNQWFLDGAATITNIVPDINSLSVRTGSATRYAAIGIGRTADDGTIGVVGVANQFFTGTAAGDFVLKGLSSNKLWFGIGGLTAAGYIDSSNRVVLGTTAASAPDAILTASSNVSPLPSNPDPSEQWPLRVGAADGKITVLGIDSFGAGMLSALVLEHARGTNAVKAAVQTGDVVGAITAHGYYTGGASGYSGGFAQVRFIAAGDFSDTSQPGQVSIWTTPIGSMAGSLVEVARFDQDRSTSLFGALSVTNIVPDINSLTIHTGSATRYAAIGIGRTADDGTIGVVGVANQFFTGTAAGDFVLKGLSSNKLWFGIGGLTAAGYIDSSNRWVLGTTASSAANAILTVSGNAAALPSASGPLQVGSADGVETVMTLDTFENFIGSAFIGRSARTSAAAPSATQAGDILAIFGAIGRGASAYSLTNAQIRMMANQTFTGSAQGTRMDFLVTPNGSTGAAIIVAGSIENDGGLTWPRTVTGGSQGAGSGNFSSLFVAGAPVLAGVTLDTDATLAANSAARVPAQSAVKSYVDNAITGIKWKPSVLCATTANITLSGEQTIDGQTTSASRVLVKNQTTGSQNGIYVSAAGAWTRATDADTAAEITQATVFVQQGTLNADTQWTCSTDNITLGTTALTFSQVSGAGTYSAGTGLSLSGNQFSIDSTVATLTGSQTLTNKTLVAPALGTPASGVATNLTGTAAGLTAGNVTTNANLTGDVTSIGNATTLTNAPVIAKVLTGYVSGAGTVAATDSILGAIQKLNGNDALALPKAGGTMSGAIAMGGNNITGAGTVAATLVTMNGGVAGFIEFLLASANFNSTADQSIAINLPTGYTRYRILNIIVSNPSVSLTTAAGGFYTAAAKGGTAIVAAGQTYSALTNNTASTSGSLMAATIVNSATAFFTANPIYFSLTTPQGSAATADISIVIQPLA
jgi:hypothetical protein